MSTGSIYIYVARFIASIDVSNAGDYKAAISVQPGTGFYKGESVAYYSKKTLTVYFQTEATEVFFSVTKLFHATDGNLRRLLYLIIKEICPSSDEVAWCSIV